MGMKRVNKLALKRIVALLSLYELFILNMQNILAYYFIHIHAVLRVAHFRSHKRWEESS